MGYVSIKPKVHNEDEKRSDDVSVNSVTSALSEELAKNPFKDPEVYKHWVKVYEDCNYECRHELDPDFEWTPAEERKLLWKLDLRVTLGASLMFIGLHIDRGNLVQAVADNLLKDLHMTTNEYNLGNTLFLVAYLCSEIPSQYISKMMGPDRWIPIQMVCWSIVATCQGAMHNKGGFFVLRIFIAIFEGGFIPDLVLWLSYFFTSKELPLRLAIFWSTMSLTLILTSLLAFAILHMRGVRGMAGWQWLFILEGLFSFLIAISGFWLMVPLIVQTKNRLHPKGWFTDREVKIAVNRLLRDDPSKGDMNNRQRLKLSEMYKALTDYDLWPMYAIALIGFIPQNTIKPYMTLTLKQLGWNRFDVNLLSIPQAALHIVIALVYTWFSSYINERALTCLLYPLVTVPCLAAIRWWPGSMHKPWPTWLLVTFILAAPYIHAICVGWCSQNSNSIRTRSMSAALFSMFTNVGSICAKQIYRKDDKPLYHRGNMQLFAIALALVPLLLFTKAYYVIKNRRRDKIWNAMTAEEQENYVLTTKDEGNKRLDFRFDH